ncbi:MAG: hypothetical protein H0Z33_13650 [Bacillaceae bacterium]|nr:hypothetical protein [Bacillaceae bacterium]
MRIVESINKENKTEFDFVKLEHWDEFDLIVDIIKDEFGFAQLQELDGVAIRKRVFSNGDFKFILMHDEHVGNYAYCESEDDVEKLRILTHKVLERIKKI